MFVSCIPIGYPKLRSDTTYLTTKTFEEAQKTTLGNLIFYPFRDSSTMVSFAFSFSFSACVSRRPFSAFSLRSLYRFVKLSFTGAITAVNFANSSATSTTLSRKLEGFIRPSSSNSCHAFAMDDWLVQQGMRIHRANSLNALTALKLWLPPFTCATQLIFECSKESDNANYWRWGDTQHKNHCNSRLFWWYIPSFSLCWSYRPSIEWDPVDLIFKYTCDCTMHLWRSNMYNRNGSKGLNEILDDS